MIKLDRRKHYTGILDVESVGTEEQAIVYDVGLVITDKKGQVQEKKGWIIKEVFEDKELMESAYYIRHYPKYLRMLAEGEFELVPFIQMQEEFNEMLERWNVKTVAAYNLEFDSGALPHTMNYLNIEGKFLRDSYQILDLWSFFCETVAQQKGFRKFAIKHELYSKFYNLKTTAEVAYRYIHNDPEFIEEHTALADCLIETEIYAHCVRQNKKHTRNKLVNRPWSLVKKATKKEIQLVV